MKTLPLFFSQFTTEQLKAQYRKNLEGLKKMLEKAKATGKKVNGYTEQQLSEIVSQFESLAA